MAQNNSRYKQIRINKFQFAILLNNEQKHIFKELTETNVYCTHCGGITEKGMVITDVYLTELQDILAHGTCGVCNSRVARYIEFGEDEAFYNKAINFRKSIQ